jgi:hypothetical protein
MIIGRRHVGTLSQMRGGEEKIHVPTVGMQRWMEEDRSTIPEVAGRETGMRGEEGV